MHAKLLITNSTYYKYIFLSIWLTSEFIISYLKPKMTILEWSFGHSQTVRYRSL